MQGANLRRAKTRLIVTIAFGEIEIHAPMCEHFIRRISSGW
jgi:hypothetical protein